MKGVGHQECMGGGGIKVVFFFSQVYKIPRTIWKLSIPLAQLLDQNSEIGGTFNTNILLLSTTNSLFCHFALKDVSCHKGGFPMHSPMSLLWK